MREYGSMTDANLLVYQVAPSHGGGEGAPPVRHYRLTARILLGLP